MNAAALVAVERAKNALKWGEQNWPDGTGPSVIRLRKRDAIQAQVNAGMKSGAVSYYQILKEEFREVACEDDESQLIDELVDVASVAMDWIETIQRRQAARAAQARLTGALSPGGSVVSDAEGAP